jgi:hypothetical protein
MYETLLFKSNYNLNRKRKFNLHNITKQNNIPICDPKYVTLLIMQRQLKIVPINRTEPIIIKKIEGTNVNTHAY